MNTITDDIGSRAVAEAQSWIGTPYQHQASVRGAGCDCLGLVLGIWRRLFGALPASVPAYSPDWSETGGQERLWQAAQLHLLAKPVTQPALGDVLLFRMRAGAVAKHLGVQSLLSRSGGCFIHAYSGRAVVQSHLGPPWQRRLVARFSFPSEVC